MFTTLTNFFGGVWARLALLALALAIVSVSAYRMGGASARADLATYQAKAAQAAQQSESEQRAIETKRAADAQKVIENAATQLNQARADAATANNAANSLRQRIAALTASGKASGNTGATGGGAGVESTDAIGLLTGVFSRMEPDARSIAAYADELKISGEACEAQYDALNAGP